MKDSIRSAFQIICVIEAAIILFLLVSFNSEKQKNQSNNMKRNQLITEQQEIAQQATWMDENVAIVDNPKNYYDIRDYAGEYYHAYSCNKRPKADSFWSLYPPEAEEIGLRPCPVCYKWR